ncbi:hypothetical protein GIB67_033980, partial [Kingdonia uniflora]
LGLHKMFAVLPEEEKGVLRAISFAPLLLIDSIATMSILVMEIFDRHLGDMKFQLGEAIIKMKPFIRCSLTKFVKNYTIFSPLEQGEKCLGERNQIEALAIGAESAIGVAPAIGVTPTIEPPIFSAPTIGSSSYATEIVDVVVRICSQLEEHDKILHNHGKILKRILVSTVGDTPLLGQYQYSTPEKIVKCKQERGNVKEDGKRKKVEPRTYKGLKKEVFADDQFDHVPLIQLKNLIPKIPRKGLANRVPRKRRVKFHELENIQSTAKNLLQQVAPGEGLEVVNDLIVDDDVEVGKEVNFNAISSEYGGDLLEMEESKNGDEKVDNVEKDGEEKES